MKKKNKAERIVKKNSIKKVIIIFSIIIAIFIAIPRQTWGWILIFFIALLFSTSDPEPLKPEITYAEFPIRIEIEYNAEVIVKEDSIICEYTGINIWQELGKTHKNRSWEMYCKTNLDERSWRIDLLKINNENREIIIRYILGAPEYYMDDPGSPTTTHPPRLNIWWHPDLGFSSEEEALNYYGIKIINVEETPPIKNSFK